MSASPDVSRIPARPRRARVLAGVALAAVVVTTALVGCAKDSWEDTCHTSEAGVIECAPNERPAAPEVTGDLLDGGRYDLTRDRNKVVVVNFWGSWCAPCRAEADDLEQVYQATKGRGVEFLGINLRDDRDKAVAFASGRITYPSIFDPAGRLALNFNVPPKTIPATIILDRQGRIAVAMRRSTTAGELRPLVERVAAEQAPPGGS